MGIFDRFPYSSTHEMNLDFMLGKATEIAESLQEIDTHKEQAEQAANNAAQSAQSAAQAAQAAAGSQTAAGTSASQAAQHKTDAEDAADRAEAASDLADEAVEQAQAAVTQAQTAATNAGTAADGAIASATAAETRINNLAASLPEDFTELNNEVTDLKSAINSIAYFTDEIVWDDGYFFFWSTGAKTTSGSYSCFTVEIEDNAVAIHITSMMSGIAGICFYDEENAYIAGSGIKNNGEGNLFSQTVKIPEGAKYIGVSCIITEKSNASISTNVKQELSVLIDDVNKKLTLPTYYDIQNLGMNQGIVNTSGSIYNPGGDYNGRYISLHLLKGDKIKASGFSFNGTYPLIVAVYDDATKEYAYTDTSTAYKDKQFAMAKDGTIYINGVNSLSLPVLKKEITITQEEFDSIIAGNSNESIPLKATYTNGKLMIKKRKSNNLSVCVVFANVGGNSLFNFYSIHNVDEESSELMNDSFESNGTEISAGSTDWFGPYVVQAVNNADGDVPEGNNYFTGGNHRSNNTGTGGGVTAVQNSLAILIDGKTPTNGEIYNAFEIIAKWSNDVQGNNTSKSTGLGRAILTENWTITITENGVYCENDIVAKEAITLKTYYGLQVYFPSSSVLMKGGNTRTPITMGSAGNSGNKTCREAVCYNSNFLVEMDIDPVDLGLFEHTDKSYVMTTANKLYCYTVSEDITINTSEHYFLKGKYEIT